MGTLLAPVTVATSLLLIMRLALTGRVASFSPGRAMLRSSSLRGSNATLMLAAAALAGLTLSIASNATRWSAIADRIGPLLAASLVLAVICLVAFKSADAVLGVVGFGAEVVTAGLEHGPGAAVSVIVLAALLLTLLGFVRGFLR